MASPTFDSNTWYRIQNFGNDFNIACQYVGSCNVNTTGMTNAEWFQVSAINGSERFYVRPKALEADDSGQPYCVNLNQGQPEIATCSEESAEWGIGFWNGNNASEGNFFYDAPADDSQRLYLTNDGVYSLHDARNATIGQQDLMRWAVRSQAVIDDEAYSTVPAVFAGSQSSSAMLSTETSTDLSTSASSDSSASSTDSASSAGLIETSTALTSVSVGPSSTVTMVVTPTVTASMSSSRASTSSPAATVVSNVAATSNPDKLMTLTLLVSIPYIFAWLS